MIGNIVAAVIIIVVLGFGLLNFKKGKTCHDCTGCPSSGQCSKEKK